MNHFRLKSFVVCASVSGLLGGVSAVRAQNGFFEGVGSYFTLESPATDEEWTHHFRVGALVGFNLKAKFSTAGNFSFSGPAHNPGPTGVGGANHEYDDGFVRVDATGNDQGATYYWGYNNASQYDGNANTLSFHSADSYTLPSSSGSADADPEIGFDLAYGGHLVRVGSALLGWEFGFGLMPIKIEDRLSGSASVIQTTHWFDTSNLGEAFFGDPNNPLGSYQGTAAGPGAKLSDVANGVASGPPIPGTLSGTRTLDVTLYSFRLGPTVHWELHPRIAVALSGGAALGIVDGELQFNETITLAGSSPNNRGSFGSTEITYGGYVAGTLMIHAVKNGDFYIGAQYMPLGGAIFSNGGREAKLDMAGAVYISAGINWPF